MTASWSSRVYALLGGAGAAMAGVVAFREQLLSFVNSNVLLESIGYADMYSYELLAAVVLIMGIGLIRPDRELAQDMMRWVQRQSAKPWRLALFIVLLFATTAVTMSQGYLYWRGREVRMRQIPQRWIMRAEEAFNGGSGTRAELYLRVCVAITDSRHCHHAHETVTEQLNEGRLLGRLHDALPNPDPRRIVVLAVKAYTDRDFDAFDSALAADEQVRHAVERKFTESVNEVIAGRCDAARPRMEAILDGAPTLDTVRWFLTACDTTPGREPINVAVAMGTEAFVTSAMRPLALSYDSDRARQFVADVQVSSSGLIDDL